MRREGSKYSPRPNDDPEEALNKIETDEAVDPAPNTDDYSGTEVPGAVIAVDVSDGGNPQRVDAFQVLGTFDGDVVVGLGTEIQSLTLGSAAGVMGFAYHQRE